MNTLGLLLLGSIAHATIFALTGIAAYLALRRWGPAAGSLASGSSLAVMVLVSVVALGPWPRWWTFPVDRATTASSQAPQAASSGEPPGSSQRSANQPPDMAQTSNVQPRPTPPDLLALVLDELRRPTTVRLSRTWGWREWLSAGFLASILLGSARLGLGLWGIARLRALSRPVHDPELDDLLQLVRAELSCTRSVELREVAELSTPATLGWRHPVLLLPADWPTWNPDERRAVLAHEVAHVRRGDFPAGVAAQLAVALHFYHPLAHWLAARLRLEQELAADSWGARLSGGKPTYLATLAQMALRRDGRAITWPARAFLPSQGTFVRRIEMLKNHGPIRHITLPLVARVVTVSTIAGLGLLVTGLRGPDGETLAAAQERPGAQPAAPVPSNDLAFVPSDARMVVVGQPATLLRRRDVRSLLNAIREGPFGVDRLPVPPEDIEQVIVFWESGAGADAAAGGPTLIPPPSGLVVRTSKAQDWKAVLTKMVGPRLAEARHDGQSYFRLETGGPVNWGAYAPNDRTIISAWEAVLRDLISDRNAPPPRHPWDDAWKKVEKGQVMLALDTRWLRRRIAQAGPGRHGPPEAALSLETFSPLYEKAQSYAVSINASDQALAIDLVAAAGSAENAKPVAETFQALLTLGKNAVQGFRRDGVRPANERSEGLEWALQASDSLLSQARIDTNAGFVHLHSAPAIDIAEGIQILAPAVSRARSDARRYQSVNNLKQIGLAFHNANSAQGRFPATANRDKGKFPYSWRVAILPYIEQQELYNQYRFDEPWDGPNNRKLIEKMPVIYAHPGAEGGPSSGRHTSYFLIDGPRTLGGAEGGAKIEQITDGTSNTIMAVEAKRDVPWTKPEDISFAPNAPAPEMGGLTPDGFNALFADGSVHYIKKSINPMVLKALFTKDGGEVVSSDSY